MTFSSSPMRGFSVYDALAEGLCGHGAFGLACGKGSITPINEEYRSLAVLATICELFPCFFVEKLPTRNGRVCRMKE